MPFNNGEQRRQRNAQANQRLRCSLTQTTDLSASLFVRRLDCTDAQTVMSSGTEVTKLFSLLLNLAEHGNSDSN